MMARARRYLPRAILPIPIDPPCAASTPRRDYLLDPPADTVVMHEE